MNFYLNKYGFQPSVIASSPQKNLGIIVVIPCYNETDLINTLNALKTCCLPSCAVEVITIINAGESTPQDIKILNRATYNSGKEWAKKNNHPALQFHFILEEELPKKHAGVGLARKIGMDEAVSRFYGIDRDGIIVCFDADSRCEVNYLTAIEEHFLEHPKTPGCAVHFEHPIDGNDFEPEIYTGIINYELHLRYYNQALKYAGLPYAFHTVGSSMAVRSSAYQKQGGMNKRKAGEDFYFIHKIIALGGFTELKCTKVIPSPRISDRVPFGTGKAIGDWVKSGDSYYKTYAFEIFSLIKRFVEIIPLLRRQELAAIELNLSATEKQVLFDFLETNKFGNALIEIRKNAKTDEAFVKRFFTWLDAFKILKMVHFMRDYLTENQLIQNEVKKLLAALRVSHLPENQVQQLIFLRNLEKK